MSSKVNSFHGGCDGCTRQVDERSFKSCLECCNFEGDWDFPDMNNCPSGGIDKEAIKSGELTYEDWAKGVEDE